MADDMARDTNGGNSQDLHDAATRIGILSQRTTNLETVVGDIRREFNQSISAVNTSIGAMSSKVDERFNSIAATIAERSRPQWQALSVMLGVLVVLGGLVYWPIRETTGDIKATLQTMTEKMVTREELDWRSQRGAEDRARTEAAIKELREGDVSRAEWQERNRARDSEIADLGRRIDEVRQAMGSVYGTRDVLLDLRERLDRLERDRIGSQSGSTMLR